MSDSLPPHESQHARPPCPSPTPGVHPDPRPLSQWCHPAISSSVIPFSSCPQSLPASESLPMSQLFAWGGQSTGVSALASSGLIVTLTPAIISHVSGTVLLFHTIRFSSFNLILYSWQSCKHKYPILVLQWENRHRYLMTYTKWYSGRDGIKMGLIWFQVLYSLYYTVYYLPKQTSEDKKKNDKMCFLKPLGLQLVMGKKHGQTLRKD